MNENAAIIEVCTRFAWHADHREWDALRALFTDVIVLDYTSLNGGEPGPVDAGQLIDNWAKVFAGFDRTQHLIANFLVEIDGDAAVCTAAFQATHRLSNAIGGSLWTLGGDYRFELTRSDGRWLISAITMQTTWGDGNQHLATLAAGGNA
jgi:hypothetical protein